MSLSIYRFIEAVVVLILLICLGALYFSAQTREKRTEIQLEAELEQLYLLEKAHFAEFGSYRKPADLLGQLEWDWAGTYEWEVREREDGFIIAARADLDGDGHEGVWLIDEDETPRKVVED